MIIRLGSSNKIYCLSSGVAKGGGGAVRPWRHFYGGGTMGYVVGYKPVQAVLKSKRF